MKKTFEIITYCSASAVLCVSLVLLINLSFDYKKINDYQLKKMVEQSDTIGLAKTKVIEQMIK